MNVKLIPLRLHALRYNILVACHQIPYKDCTDYIDYINQTVMSNTHLMAPHDLLNIIDAINTAFSVLTENNKGRKENC